MLEMQNSVIDADCILLAAGESRRMGRSKQLIEVRGKTIFRHSLELALQCCKRVIAVQGAVDLRPEIPSEGNVELINNADYKAGQLGSLQHGIRALRTDAFFVLLSDLISIKPGTFFHLAASMNGRHAVYPICKGRMGHPVLLDRHAARLILAANPANKAMKVIQPLNPIPIDVDDRGIYMDIDTEEDLVRQQACH